MEQKNNTVNAELNDLYEYFITVYSGEDLLNSDVNLNNDMHTDVNGEVNGDITME